ncbi:MAG: 3-hydroxyacyl-CoA dehydrogenase family protein [Clostridiaceae bacterium]|nr:3-hydroxyacyl-CoA dehydrogenase family protein [Clostridiaceae bacterium]
MRDSVLIYGSGMMGCAIGCCAALANNNAILFDINPAVRENAIERVSNNLKELVDLSLITEEQAKEAMKYISISDNVESSCEKAKVVIEAVFENLEIKQDVFRVLDELLPESVPILSNTSGLRITDIAAKTKHPERTLTAHFWLPATLIPLVEVVIGDNSSPKLAEEIKEMLLSWGKAPVIVKKDLPGQLANRILQAVIREAVNIVETGLASPEDVDTAIKMGMALRFPVWGPLEHVDAAGVDLCCSVQNTVLPEISGRSDASPLFSKLIDNGNLGYKSGEGFYNWSKKDMNALIKKRNEFIVHALKKI